MVTGWKVRYLWGGMLRSAGADWLGWLCLPERPVLPSPEAGWLRWLCFPERPELPSAEVAPRWGDNRRIFGGDSLCRSYDLGTDLGREQPVS